STRLLHLHQKDFPLRMVTLPGTCKAFKPLLMLSTMTPVLEDDSKKRFFHVQSHYPRKAICTSWKHIASLNSRTPLFAPTVSDWEQMPLLAAASKRSLKRIQRACSQAIPWRAHA